jgi:molecular chaperone HscA
MALLQIAEPGQSAAPHQHRLAVGIDLGTTNSLVAAVRSGVAEPLVDEQNRAILPSIVHYDSNRIVVGYDAKLAGLSTPEHTVYSIKRLMGRGLSDIQNRYPHLPYHFVASEQGLPLIKTPKGELNPIQISADILSSLASRAQESLGGDLEGAVITVPAYFDDAQRSATKEAAKLAGLNVLRLLNEPTAAAVAYGLDSGQEGIIAVYDLGGGTFDVSILRLSKGIFEVLSTGGDSALGGDDFDLVIVEWILSEQKEKTELSAIQRRQLLTLASELKIELSEKECVSVQWEGWQGELTRAHFDTLIQPLVKKTLMACRRALRDADVETGDVIEAVMVGGSTRVPFVRQSVGAFFEREPLTSIDPDQVVAIGAAIQADILIGNKPDSDMLLLDVIPLSLGIETMGGMIEKILPRNTTIPAARAQEFTTFKDAQTAMTVHVVQGEREMVTDCRSLARFALKGLPPMTAGAAHIRVTYQVDADGLLSVTAMEKSTKIQASIQVKPSFGLSDDEIANMIRASMTNAEADKNARYLAEQRMEADRVLEGLISALAQDGDTLLSPMERKELETVMLELVALRQGEDARAIEDSIKKTDKASQEFASRRMDQSIRHALAGQSIDEV